MVLGKKSQEVHNAFIKYVETGNKSLINNFTRDEIGFTILQCSRHSKGWNFYEAMEKRVTELNEKEKNKRNTRDKWVDRLIGFAFAVILTIIGFALKYLFFPLD